MVDHATLLKRLSCSVRVSGVVRSWIESLWQNTVCTHGLTFISCDSMRCRCTQGSVLGPLLFSVYTSPLSTITQSTITFPYPTPISAKISGCSP